jgi:hypothetical protein
MLREKQNLLTPQLKSVKIFCSKEALLLNLKCIIANYDQIFDMNKNDFVPFSLIHLLAVKIKMLQHVAVDVGVRKLQLYETCKKTLI